MTNGDFIDIAFALIGAALIIRGCWRGLSGEILSLAGTLGGFFLAWRFGPHLGEIIARRFDWSTGAGAALGMVLIFAAVSVAAALTDRLAKAFLRFARLQMLDRLLGGTSGLAKTFLMVLLAYGAALFIAAQGIPLPAVEESRAFALSGAVWPWFSQTLTSCGFTMPEVNLPQLVNGQLLTPALLSGEIPLSINRNISRDTPQSHDNEPR